MTIASQLDRDAFASTLDQFHDLGLLSPSDTDEVLALFDPEFPYADAVAAAQSIHVHVKVADVDALPHDAITAQGVTATSCTDGYIKYPFPGGINMIFSSIDIAEDDMLDEPVATPMLDHKGIDLRDERGCARDLRRRAGTCRRGRLASRAPGRGRPAGVLLPHRGEREALGVPGRRRRRTSAADKFAFGPLEIHDSKMGCDLRPIDPAHPPRRRRRRPWPHPGVARSDRRQRRQHRATTSAATSVTSPASVTTPSR